MACPLFVLAHITCKNGHLLVNLFYRKDILKRCKFSAPTFPALSCMHTPARKGKPFLFVRVGTQRRLCRSSFAFRFWFSPQLLFVSKVAFFEGGYVCRQATWNRPLLLLSEFPGNLAVNIFSMNTQLFVRVYVYSCICWSGLSSQVSFVSSTLPG